MHPTLIATSQIVHAQENFELINTLRPVDIMKNKATRINMTSLTKGFTLIEILNIVLTYDVYSIVSGLLQLIYPVRVRSVSCYISSCN